MSDYTAETPAQCPRCGRALTESTGRGTDEVYSYDCGHCGWDDEYAVRFTVATAPWTRDLWAEVERARAERDEARRDLARIVKACGWDCDGNDPESPTGAVHIYMDGLQAAQELLVERREADADADRLRRTLAVVLARFAEPGHLGASGDCLRTEWVQAELVNEWREILEASRVR